MHCKEKTCGNVYQNLETRFSAKRLFQSLVYILGELKQIQAFFPSSKSLFQIFFFNYHNLVAHSFFCYTQLDRSLANLLNVTLTFATSLTAYLEDRRHPVDNFMFKVKKASTIKIWIMFRIKKHLTTERCHLQISIVNFEHIHHSNLMFLLLTLSK